MLESVIYIKENGNLNCYKVKYDRAKLINTINNISLDLGALICTSIDKPKSARITKIGNKKVGVDITESYKNFGEIVYEAYANEASIIEGLLKYETISYGDEFIDMISFLKVYKAITEDYDYKNVEQLRYLKKFINEFIIDKQVSLPDATFLQPDYYELVGNINAKVIKLSNLIDEDSTKEEIIENIVKIKK